MAQKRAEIIYSQQQLSTKEKNKDLTSSGLVMVQSIMHLDLLCEISDELRTGRK